MGLNKEARGYAVLMPLAPWESPRILAEALRSLAAQSWPPSQVAVSCDGPPPAALQKPLQGSGLPIQILIGPGNEGVGPVLARGLRHCRHELVVRADADDISRPERCETQLRWMEDHPEVVALGSVIEEFRKAPENVVSQRRVPIGSAAIQRWAVSRNPLNHPSVVLRRSKVLTAGSYRSRKGFEDYDLWLRLLHRYGSASLANLPDPLVLARVGEAHLSRRHGLHYAMEEFRFFIVCGREGLLSWHHVARALAVRLPLRLLPSRLLRFVMARVREMSRGG